MDYMIDVAFDRLVDVVELWDLEFPQFTFTPASLRGTAGNTSDKLAVIGACLNGTFENCYDGRVQPAIEMVLEEAFGSLAQVPCAV